MRALSDRTDLNAAEEPEFCYSAEQRKKILRTLPPDVNSKILMARLTMAAQIAINPERKGWVYPSAKQIKTLLKKFKAFDAIDRALLAHAAGIGVQNLTIGIQGLIANPPKSLAPHPRSERRRNFVLNVCLAWIEETETTRWPLKSVKDSSPLLRLAEAALPEELQKHNARGSSVSLRRTMIDVLRNWDQLTAGLDSRLIKTGKRR
jgi:hypothetical protein